MPGPQKGHSTRDYRTASGCAVEECETGCQDIRPLDSALPIIFHVISLAFFIYAVMEMDEMISKASPVSTVCDSPPTTSKNKALERSRQGEGFFPV